MRRTAPAVIAAALAVATLAAQTGQQKLTGVGDTVSPPIALPKGLVMIGGAYKGAGLFAVTLLSADGTSSDLAVNTLGDYQGVRLVAVDGGTYRVAVRADRPWTVLYEAVSPSKPADAGPFKASGSGDSVRGPVHLKPGLLTAQLDHRGRAYFGVTLFRANGEYIGALANTIGVYHGTTAQRIETEGDYYADIKADGAWTITAEP